MNSEDHRKKIEVMFGMQETSICMTERSNEIKSNQNSQQEFDQYFQNVHFFSVLNGFFARIFHLKRFSSSSYGLEHK